MIPIEVGRHGFLGHCHFVSFKNRNNKEVGLLTFPKPNSLMVTLSWSREDQFYGFVDFLSHTSDNSNSICVATAQTPSDTLTACGKITFVWIFT